MELLKDENGSLLILHLIFQQKKYKIFMKTILFQIMKVRNKMSLIEHFSKNEYLKNLIDSVGFRKKILEVGSGTSQL